MKTLKVILKLAAAFALLLVAFTGCESSNGGGNVSGSVYYGVGFYDPWYYGDYYYPPDIIITPPPAGTTPPVCPEQPIYNPSPRPTPMPSIPRTPRPRAR